MGLTQHTDTPRGSIRGVQLLGLLLWRTGLLVAAASALYHTIEIVLRFIDLPQRLEIGIGLIIAGIVFVACSFIMERVIDYRGEGDLSK